MRKMLVLALLAATTVLFLRARPALVQEGGDGGKPGPTFAATPVLQALAAARVIDLTHAIDEKTPHWPGKGYHPFRAETIATLDEDGVFSRVFCMPEHLGTHMDAPNHFVPGKRAVDEIPAGELHGEACVLDLSEKVKADADAVVSPRDLETFERAFGRIPAGAFVLVRTGWAARAGDTNAYANRDAGGRLHFPGFSPDAARLLVGRKVRAVGIDTLSIDRGLSTTFDVHKILSGAEVYALENLNERLGELPARGAVVFAFPLKMKGGSGGPARVIAYAPR